MMIDHFIPELISLRSFCQFVEVNASDPFASMVTLTACEIFLNSGNRVIAFAVDAAPQSVLDMNGYAPDFQRDCCGNAALLSQRNTIGAMRLGVGFRRGYFQSCCMSVGRCPRDRLDETN
jgi:hypothetical protein